MSITRRPLAAAGALAFAAVSLPSAGHAESADEAAVRKAVDDLVKAMIAADKAKLDGIAATAVPEEHVPAPEGLAELPPETAAETTELPELADLPDTEAPPVELMDERYADVDHMAEGETAEAPAPQHTEEDDGPIALSADELDGIVADAHEALVLPRHLVDQRALDRADVLVLVDEHVVVAGAQQRGDVGVARVL